MQFMEPVESIEILQHTIMAAIRTTQPEMLQQNVTLMLVFPTLQKLHTWNFLTANSKYLVIFIFASLYYGYENIKHQTYFVDILY